MPLILPATQILPQKAYAILLLLRPVRHIELAVPIRALAGSHVTYFPAYSAAKSGKAI